MPQGYESETARNIRLYRAALPKMRGRVAAVLWMLVISAALLTGTTFAWVTLSTSPEVTGVTTTVTANGALEIALSDADGLEPDTSAVGDSSAAQDVTKSNLTWGNLVNLSDSSYGLGDIVLRPAVLNLVGLQSSPLQAVSYGADGRATAYTSSFGYASSYDESAGTFAVATDPEDEENTTYMEYGVRAISYMSYEDEDANSEYAALKSAAYSLLAQTEADYSTLVNNQTYIDALADVMYQWICAYIVENGDLNSTVAEMFTTDGDVTGSIEALYKMAVGLQTVYEELGEAYAAVAMLQQAAANSGEYGEWTIDTLLAADESELERMGISVTALSSYAEDREALDGYIEDLYVCYEGYMNRAESVSLEAVSDALVFILAPEKASLAGYVLEETAITTAWLMSIAEISDGTGSTEAMSVVVNSGMLYRLENQIQGRIAAYSLFAMEVSGLTANVYLYVTTSAATMTAWTDYTSAAGVSSFAGTDAVAKETYAMAIDLWVRTNSAGTYLTLEGEVQTDGDGEIVGYAGSNRVWEDYEMTTNGAATTQGTGSCYIFTCDDPVEALRITELLDAMTVAFVSADGALLGYADMDTDSIWQDYGRYVVPLTVRSTGANYVTETDDEGEETTSYYITPLTQNKAERITVIVYLDGTRLTNEQASAAQDIVGQLNIQFGSTGSLMPTENEELYSETISLDSVSQSEASFEYDGSEQSVTLTAKLSGDGISADSTVTGYFLRAINSSQGVPQETLTFTYADGEWTTTAGFTAPGDYILNRLTVDGVSYSLSDLSGEVYTSVEVTVAGYALTNVSVYENELFSTGSSAGTEVTFTISDTTSAVESVGGVFLSSDGKAVSAEMTCTNATANTWTGTFTFATSGTYTLTYVYINGNAYDVGSLQETVEVTLGVGARVWIMAADGTTFADGESATYFTIPDDGMKLTARVELTDNAGNTLEALDNAMTLNYLSAVGGIELDTNLTWNASTGYYEGDFNVALGGIYSFSSITLDSNTISRVSYAPTVTAIATGEPYYYANSTESYQVELDGGAVMSVEFANTSGAQSVTAVISGGYRTDDDDYTVTETVNGTVGSTYISNDGAAVTAWTFVVPESGDGTQNGSWQITSITVEISDGTETEKTVLDVSSENITTKVVSTLEVTVTSETATATFTNDFMQDNEVSGISLTLTDYEGAGVESAYVSNVELGYYYSTGGVSTLSGATSSKVAWLKETDGGYFPDAFPAEFSSTGHTSYAASASNTGNILVHNGDYDTETNEEWEEYAYSAKAMSVTGYSQSAGTWDFESMNFRVIGIYCGGIYFTVGEHDYVVVDNGFNGSASSYAYDITPRIVESSHVSIIKPTTDGPVTVAENALPRINVVWNKINATITAVTGGTYEGNTATVSVIENTDGSYTLPTVTFTLSGVPADKIESVALYNAKVGSSKTNVELERDADGNWVWTVGVLTGDSYSSGSISSSAYLILSYDGLTATIGNLTDKITVNWK